MTIINRLSLITSVLELAAQSLPEGMRLYDFGGNNIVAPKPDVYSNPSGYLTDHMAAIERTRETKSDPIILTGFGVDLQFVTARQLVDLMETAAEHNKNQTKQFEILT